MRIRKFFALCFLLCSTLLFLEARQAIAAPFSTSREYHAMQNRRSPRDQRSRIQAIENYFRRVNPRVSAANASRYAALIEQYAAQYKLDPFLIAAVLVNESTVRANVVSKGNYGLMQINWRANGPWIRKTFPIRTTKQLLEPENNIRVGAHILSANIRRASGNVDTGLDRYRGRSLSSYRNNVMRHYSAMYRIFSSR